MQILILTCGRWDQERNTLPSLSGKHWKSSCRQHLCSSRYTSMQSIYEVKALMNGASFIAWVKRWFIAPKFGSELQTLRAGRVLCCRPFSWGRDLRCWMLSFRLMLSRNKTRRIAGMTRRNVKEHSQQGSKYLYFVANIHSSTPCSQAGICSYFKYEVVLYPVCKIVM